MRIMSKMHFKLKSKDLKDKEKIWNKNSNIYRKDIVIYL